MSELFALQKKEDKESLRKAILEHVEIPKYILKALAGPNAGKFKVSQRLWLKSLGGLVTDGGLSFSRKSDLFDPKTTAEGLLRSEDKEISSNALVVYGVRAFEEIAQSSDRRRMSEKMAELSTTLKNFSTAESDVKDKLAVARILNHCFGYLIEMGLIEGELMEEQPPSREIQQSRCVCTLFRFEYLDGAHQTSFGRRLDRPIGRHQFRVPNASLHGKFV